MDAVYIPLINNLHFEWSYKSLSKGLNLLCEKPFTLNSREAASLLHLAEESGLMIREGFMYRFHPLYEFVKRLISEQKLGRLRSLYSVFTFLMMTLVRIYLRGNIAVVH